MDAFRRERLVRMVGNGVLSEAASGDADRPVIPARMLITLGALSPLDLYVRKVEPVWREILRDRQNVEENGEPPLPGNPGVTAEDFEDYFDEYVLTHVPGSLRESRVFWSILDAVIENSFSVDWGVFLRWGVYRAVLRDLTGVEMTDEGGLLSPREVFELSPALAKGVAWLYDRVTPARWGEFVDKLVEGGWGPQFEHEFGLRGREFLDVGVVVARLRRFGSDANTRALLLAAYAANVR